MGAHSCILGCLAVAQKGLVALEGVNIGGISWQRIVTYPSSDRRADMLCTPGAFRNITRDQQTPLVRVKERQCQAGEAGFAESQSGKRSPPPLHLVMRQKDREPGADRPRGRGQVLSGRKFCTPRYHYRHLDFS